VAGDDYPTCPSLLMNDWRRWAQRHSAVRSNNTLFWAHGAQSVWRASGILHSERSGHTIDLHNRIDFSILHFVPLEVVAIVIVWFAWLWWRRHFKKSQIALHRCRIWFAADASLGGLQLVDLALRKGGSSLLQAAPKFGEELAIYGLIALSQGALLVSMVWAAALAYMLDRRFLPLLDGCWREPFSPFLVSSMHTI